MLFNSHIFIFLFLPIALLVYYGTAKRNFIVALGGLSVASLVFYSWWNLAYSALILLSIVGNFLLSRGIATAPQGRAKALTVLGVAANLALLGYYKYANFFVDSGNQLFGTGFYLPPVVLPLAISFYTFQQIAFLVDTYRGEIREYSPIKYALFITFFPQLIAGPIVHHKEMLPQFEKQRSSVSENLAIGISIFTIGLFKKVAIADSVAPYASGVFALAEAGNNIDFFEAWGGALAYTLQLYFDFSGYSDMAIGLARMFGIVLPLNFYSPYKSRNIVDFWRRWHITLSRFLRDYLYIGLGGNRRGELARSRNLLFTMLLGGLWHGAAWTFIAWGALHGSYLVICHAWQKLTRPLDEYRLYRTVATPIGYGVTFIAVVAGWVLFRAESFATAGSILGSMAGFNGVVLSPEFSQLAGLLPNAAVTEFAGRVIDDSAWGLILALLLAVWLMPNTAQIFYATNPVLDEGGLLQQSRIRWRANTWWSILIGLIALYCLLNLNQVSEFLYFDF